MYKPILVFLCFLLLTILTQLGGIIFLIALFINKRVRFKNQKLRFFTFPILYLLCTFIIIPPLAQLTGRVALPLFNSNKIKPHTVWTGISNRHYIKPELKQAIEYVANASEPIYYLDANFPFIDGFPLLPHWSHNDGRKLDIAFAYQDTEGNRAQPFSFLGYGYCESPKSGEMNMPHQCANQGFIQYSLLEKLVYQKQEVYVDEKATQHLIKQLSAHSSIGKIFIEPHLKQRWGLSNNSKIRFHGCHAVRHDDHIHVQL